MILFVHFKTSLFPLVIWSTSYCLILDWSFSFVDVLIGCFLFQTIFLQYFLLYFFILLFKQGASYAMDIFYSVTSVKTLKTLLELGSKLQLSGLYPQQSFEGHTQTPLDWRVKVYLTSELQAPCSACNAFQTFLYPLDLWSPGFHLTMWRSIYPLKMSQLLTSTNMLCFALPLNIS